jgi:hypothetical protein
MTRTWKKAGLDIVKGQNHFTIGKVIGATSSRFNPLSLVYQSWLGGYSVKLASNKTWSVEDYCKLAIADQNSWLRWYGDPNPFTSIDDWTYSEAGTIRTVSGHIGTLYEGGFTSHSDIGPNLDTPRSRFASHSLAALYNSANSTLNLTAEMLTPRNNGYPYHQIKGRVYLAVFDVRLGVRVILYANGIRRRSAPTDTFEVLRNEFLRTMKNCEILEM